MPSTAKLTAGDRVGGARFILKRVLGRGDFTVVWLARDVKRQEEVALKILPDPLLRDPNAIERLKTETVRNVQLSHPNIARTFEFVQDYQLIAVAIEYVQGWSLPALRVDKPEKRYEIAEITPWIRQVCAALDYAHNDANLVHGSLKPSNLLLDQHADLKITDFGIARSLQSMTAAGDFNRAAATLGFMSPQQALGENPSVLDDVYAVGATIYDLLTGTPPFYKGQVLAQICERKPQSMTERLEELGFQGSIPDVVEDTVAACIEKEPAKRPPNIQAVLRLLERSDHSSPSSSRRLPRHSEAAAGAEAVTPPLELISATEKNAIAPRDQTSLASSPITPIIPIIPSEPPAPPDPPTLSQMSQPSVEEASPISPISPSGPIIPIPPVEQPAQQRTRRSVFAVSAGVAVLLVLGLVIWTLHTSKSSGAKSTLAGTVDPTFTTPTNVDREIRAAVIQPDKKIVIAGMFSQFGDSARRSLARLNPDGTVDDTFTCSTGGDVHALALEPDGHLVIGGEFSKVNDSTRRRIARLNPDGTLDDGFRATAGANRDVRSIVIQSDGKILLAGSFDLSSGKKLNRIARFNSDGTRDNTFEPGSAANAVIWSLALQPDGRILAGGDFTSFNQRAYSRIVRLDSSGSVDETFKLDGGANAQIFAVAVQKNGKILIGGDFIRVNQFERNHIARLNADGSLDSSFDPGAGPNSGVRCLSLQPDGKILIGGIFTSVQGIPRSKIARLNSDGSLDKRFDPGEGASEVVRWVGTQPDGKVLLAGGFSKVAGLDRNRIARLNGDVP